MDGARRDESLRQTLEARRLIGVSLLVLLIVIVAAGFAGLYTVEAELHALNRQVIAAIAGGGDQTHLAEFARLAADQSRDDADRLAGLLNIVFGPVATLLGSVTGFYFGSKRTR